VVTGGRAGTDWLVGPLCNGNWYTGPPNNCSVASKRRRTIGEEGRCILWGTVSLFSKNNARVRQEGFEKTERKGWKGRVARVTEGRESQTFELGSTRCLAKCLKKNFGLLEGTKT